MHHTSITCLVNACCMHAHMPIYVILHPSSVSYASGYHLYIKKMLKGPLFPFLVIMCFISSSVGFYFILLSRPRF